ncbi:MAG: YqcI/YcgG family protein [Acidovorax sp.]
MANENCLSPSEVIISPEVPAWAKSQYLTIKEKVTQQDFPCYFGMQGMKREEVRIGFGCHHNWNSLAVGLRSFIEFFEGSIGKGIKYNYIYIFEPLQDANAKGFEFYEREFWRVLNWLHEKDSQPWPKDIPSDVRHEDWEFCFGGMPFFLFAGFPAYRRRISRKFGNSMVMLFQPKAVFEDIASGTKAGTHARKIIRDRLVKYEFPVPLHPGFTTIDEEMKVRWKQYIIPDDEVLKLGECPFNHRSEVVCR